MGKSHKRDREEEDPEARELRREAKKAEKVPFYLPIPASTVMMFISLFLLSDGQSARLFQ